MFLLLFTLFPLLHLISGDEDLTLLATLHSDYLQTFSGYGTAVIMHFQVPDDMEFISFRFEADQTQYSLFNCGFDEVLLYMRHGSIPVVNPSDAKFPKEFFNITQADLKYLHFLSDKSSHYINFTSPKAGFYYAAVFHPYVNPQSQGITQAGLIPQCSTFIDADLYIKKYVLLNLDGTNKTAVKIPIDAKRNQTYKVYIPSNHDRLILTVKDIIFCDNCIKLTVQLIDISGDPNNYETMVVQKATYDGNPVYLRLNTNKNRWYYMQFYFKTTKPSPGVFSYVSFEIKTFLATSKKIIFDKYKLDSKKNNYSFIEMYNSATLNSLRSNDRVTYRPYKDYDLVRLDKTDSFTFSFELHPRKDGSMPLAVNLTSDDFTVMQFYLHNSVDTGGTLSFIVGFAPRINRMNDLFIKENEPESHTVITCIRNNVMEIPTWPGNCTSGNTSNISPVVLNNNATNVTALLAYPEAGLWYLTMKLYCGKCVPCNCPKICLETYRICLRDCETGCSEKVCVNCSTDCERDVLSIPSCKNVCNCDGPCQRSNVTCKSSVLFDLSSYPCIDGGCGRNGRCVFTISQGVLFSTCLCINNYKGYDCTDDSDAQPYAMVVLELCLLVISNVIFIPAAYVAFRRSYNIEAIVYTATFLSSTFYHACDAGENIISFCIVRLAVLQFSDFFAGLLSIWVTLIAMAYLLYPWYSIAHITGCVVLAFGTTYDKTSIWVFVVPAVSGVVIVVGRWVYLRKVTGKMFPSKVYLTRYLPVGLIVVTVGFFLYALLQTQSNYKYIHSLWHILMGVGVIILLPDLKVFLPPPAPENANSNHLLVTS